MDYDRMYPQKGILLQLLFENFKSKVMPFIKSSVKKSKFDFKTEALENLERINKLSSYTSDFLALYYLPYYIKPSKQVKLVDSTIKPTIKECQDHFIFLVQVWIF